MKKKSYNALDLAMERLAPGRGPGVYTQSQLNKPKRKTKFPK